MGQALYEWDRAKQLIAVRTLQTGEANEVPGRVGFRPADRVLLAALARLLPRLSGVRSSSPVKLPRWQRPSDPEAINECVPTYIRRLR